MGPHLKGAQPHYRGRNSLLAHELQPLTHRGRILLFFSTPFPSRSTVAPSPNFSVTKSPVLKPAPGRISWNICAPLSARRQRSTVLCNTKHARKRFFHSCILPRVEQS